MLTRTNINLYIHKFSFPKCPQHFEIKLGELFFFYYIYVIFAIFCSNKYTV